MNGLTLLLIVLAAAGLLAAVAVLAADETDSKLPPTETQDGMSLTEALTKRRSVRSFKTEALSAEQIAQLCWAAQGITDSRRGFRTAPSAGALYPLELYVVTADGVRHYDPGKNRLDDHVDGDVRQQLEAAALGLRFVGQAPATFVIATVMARTERKYGRRAGRYVWMEVGHSGQNLLLQAAALNLGAVPVGAFDDERVAQALSLPADHARAYLIPVGTPK